MKIIIAPGAFKHSLSASQAAQAIGRGIGRSGLKAELHLLPIADGGNGTLEAFLANDGQRVEVLVQDPLQRPVQAAFGLLDNGQTAVIEMALASGIELLSDDELNPLLASTYGTGMLLKAALEKGARRFIIGMGGSATVDGGAGCLQALGVRLLDAQGQEIPLGGGSLHLIRQIDLGGLDPLWQACEVIIASDVENPTLGEEGAAAVFGPQKGAGPADVLVLEDNLRHFFTLLRDQLGVDVLMARGGGAAGALSAGLMGCLGGRVESGIDLILAHHHFDVHVEGAALVITGEGQMDAQTVYGKGPLGVARRAQKFAVPTVGIVGSLNVDDQVLHDAGIHAVLPVMTKPMALADALRDADVLVEQAGLRLGYLLQLKREG